MANMPIFGKKFQTKIIKNNIPTYTNKSGCYGKENIFPIHQMKPCQVGWRKLVIHEKISSVEEKSSYFKENTFIHRL